MLRIAVGRVRPDYGRVLYRGRFLARPSLAILAREGLMYGTQDSALTPLFSVRDRRERRADLGHGRHDALARGRTPRHESVNLGPHRCSGADAPRHLEDRAGTIIQESMPWPASRPVRFSRSPPSFSWV